MTEQEIKENDKNRKKAAIYSSLIMAAIIAILFLVVFGNNFVAEDLESGGVSVSLGEPDAGGPSDEASAEQTKSSTVQEQVDDPLLSQDNEDAPEIKKTDKPKPKTEAKPKMDSDVSDILNGLGKRKTEGTGDGKKTGNEGKENGDGDGDGDGLGKGGSAGNGVGISDYSLGNRKLVSAPKNDDEFNVNGKVIVTIWVDRYGKVTRTEIARGSASSIQLRDLAEKLAKKTEFQSSFTDDNLKKGSITFNFKI